MLPYKESTLGFGGISVRRYNHDTLTNDYRNRVKVVLSINCTYRLSNISFQTTCLIASSTSSSHVLVCCGIPMMKKRIASSVIWDYFKLKVNPEGSMISAEATFPVCHSSGKSVLAKGGNTTNLLSHLREHHPGLYSEPYPKNARKKQLIVRQQLL